MQTTNTLENRLSRAADYREFLKEFLETTGPMGGKSNYAELSRKAGLRSRSFLREVITGKKQISSKSFAALVKVFSYNETIEKFFSYLVRKNVPELRLANDTDELIDQEISYLRKQLAAGTMQRTQIHSTQEKFKFLETPHTPWILAAIDQNGTNLEQISQRSNIQQKKLLPLLDTLVKEEILAFNKENNFYLPKNMNPIINASSMWLHQKNTLQSIAEVRKKIQEFSPNQKNEKRLFLSSNHLLIEEKNFENFSIELSNLIQKYCEKSNTQGADRVIEVLSFISKA